MGETTHRLKQLSRCRPFRDLDTRQLEETLREPSIRYRPFKAGSLIHQQGEPYNRLIILLAGSVDTIMHDVTGKTMNVEIIEAPAIIASGIFFADDRTMPVSIYAHDEVELLLLPLPAVIDLGKRNPDLFLSLLRDSGNRIVTLAQKLRFSKFSTIRQKIAIYLLECAEKQQSEVVTLGHTRSALAELFGVSRPSLSRTFSELSDSGVIRPIGRRVAITSRNALLNMSGRS
jgi:CRP-like cAMP-binding protein